MQVRGVDVGEHRDLSETVDLHMGELADMVDTGVWRSLPC